MAEGEIIEGALEEDLEVEEADKVVGGITGPVLSTHLLKNEEGLGKPVRG